MPKARYRPVLALLLAACGDPGDADDTGTTPAATGATAASTTDVATSKPGTSGELLTTTTAPTTGGTIQNLGSAGTRLWWPPQETGKISLKAVARTRTDIPLPPPAESGLLDLVLRFSPKPFGPLTMQEVGMLDRFSGNLLVETISRGDATGQQESATYVVNPEASPAAQIAVEIPVSR